MLRIIYFIFKIYLFIYLWPCQVFLSLAVVHRLLIVVASLAVDHGL